MCQGVNSRYLWVWWWQLTFLLCSFLYSKAILKIEKLNKGSQKTHKNRDEMSLDEKNLWQDQAFLLCPDFHMEVLCPRMPCRPAYLLVQISGWRCFGFHSRAEVFHFSRVPQNHPKELVKQADSCTLPLEILIQILRGAQETTFKHPRKFLSGLTAAGLLQHVFLSSFSFSLPNQYHLKPSPSFCAPQEGTAASRPPHIALEGCHLTKLTTKNTRSEEPKGSDSLLSEKG